MEAEPDIKWSQAWSVDEKLDYISNHLRVLSIRMDQIDAIGQMVTNVDKFCADIAATLSSMQNSKNPMMRMMMPPGLVMPGGIPQ